MHVHMHTCAHTSDRGCKVAGDSKSARSSQELIVMAFILQVEREETGGEGRGGVLIQRVRMQDLPTSLSCVFIKMILPVSI